MLVLLLGGDDDPADWGEERMFEEAKATIIRESPIMVTYLSRIKYAGMVEAGDMMVDVGDEATCRLLVEDDRLPNSSRRGNMPSLVRRLMRLTECNIELIW